MRRITRNSAAAMSTKQLRKKLKTAGRPANGSREDLIKRYDSFIRDTLAEEGMSSPSENESDGDRATANPALIMIDEVTGNR